MLASNFVFLLALFALTAPRWHMPTLGQTWLCLLVGGLGGMGQLGLFEAFRRAPASLLAPVEYTALLWAFLLGAMVWSDVPAWGVFAGAALIGLAGLSLLITKRIDFPAEFVSRARPKR
jgi:drug/metabolite transporter (DMT)-like permease